MRKLSAEQTEAIGFFKSPLVLMGSAGTGKTTVLAHKIGHII
ncbi:hypothetical protein EBR96_04650, partial [bacterium]|nr:hypothetical protein [bacterium]